jgi:hypothetical protein
MTVTLEPPDHLQTELKSEAAHSYELIRDASSSPPAGLRA